MIIQVFTPDMLRRNAGTAISQGPKGMCIHSIVLYLNEPPCVGFENGLNTCEFVFLGCLNKHSSHAISERHKDMSGCCITAGRVQNLYMYNIYSTKNHMYDRFLLPTAAWVLIIQQNWGS